MVGTKGGGRAGWGGEAGAMSSLRRRSSGRPGAAGRAAHWPPKARRSFLVRLRIGWFDLRARHAARRPWARVEGGERGRVSDNAAQITSSPVI